MPSIRMLLLLVLCIVELVSVLWGSIIFNFIHNKSGEFDCSRAKTFVDIQFTSRFALISFAVQSEVFRPHRTAEGVLVVPLCCRGSAALQ